MTARMIDYKTIQFSSGRTRVGGEGCFSVTSRMHAIEHGHDGCLDWPGWTDDDGKFVGLSDADILELADLMIERWKAFKSTITTQCIFESRPSGWREGGSVNWSACATGVVWCRIHGFDCPQLKGEPLNQQ